MTNDAGPGRLFETLEQRCFLLWSVKGAIAGNNVAHRSGRAYDRGVERRPRQSRRVRPEPEES
jgi:hypothetical protein